MVDWKKRIVVKSQSGLYSKMATYTARVLCTDRLCTFEEGECVVAVKLNENYEAIWIFDKEGNEIEGMRNAYYSYVENA